MSDTATDLTLASVRSDWVRLRTLIVLRWIAIAGQLSAIVVARWLFDLDLPLGACLAVVAASVIANLVSMFAFPETRRLSEGETALTLLFDIAQLAALLFLTGGLNNPFALLILAPVAISATALRLRSTVVLGAAAILLVTFVTWVHLPLRTVAGDEMSMPPEFVFGFWVAIVIGIVFVSAYARRVALEAQVMSEALQATQLALARAQKLTDLGGVVAAAAHELGTPLATIKLASGELAEELQDRPELLDDARLIGQQADRCRDILRSMGRAGKDDLHLRTAPLDAVLREAAEPHTQRGRSVRIAVGPAEGSATRQPHILRRPEIIHGLRNLVQNAVDFARDEVSVDAEWDTRRITLRIADDGPGFPPQLLGRIGEPFVGRRRGARRRPAYEGMGLGLFIAKTLLERTGAELSFANLPSDGGSQPGGALVVVVWPRERIAAEPAEPGEGLGENRPIDP